MLASKSWHSCRRQRKICRTYSNHGRKLLKFCWNEKKYKNFERELPSLFLQEKITAGKDKPAPEFVEQIEPQNRAKLRVLDDSQPRDQLDSRPSSWIPVLPMMSHPTLRRSRKCSLAPLSCGNGTCLTLLNSTVALSRKRRHEVHVQRC